MQFELQILSARGHQLHNQPLATLWDPEKPDEVKAAAATFIKCLEAKMSAFAVIDGVSTKLTEFNPNVSTVIVGRMAGG